MENNNYLMKPTPKMSVTTNQEWQIIHCNKKNKIPIISKTVSCNNFLKNKLISISAKGEAFEVWRENKKKCYYQQINRPDSQIFISTKFFDLNFFLFVTQNWEKALHTPDILCI